jgi:Rod binding domain-containing protein
MIPSNAAAGFSALSAQSDARVDLKSANTKAKARAAAEDFEAVFLNSMFSQMFTNIDGEGPFGGGEAVGVWRSFLTDEYAKSFAKSGGIGLADDVYRNLLEIQERSAR